MPESMLLIVDGDNLAHRAYHSTPKTVLGADGRTINAIVGFFSMLSRIWQEEREGREKPLRIFVAWDTLGVDTYRSKLWPPYQGGRVFEPDIVRQLDMLPILCGACMIGYGREAGYEADDFMASASTAEINRGGGCLILTTDKDAYQLASENVTILSPKRGTRELDRIGPEEVVKRFGVLPEQVPDFKALAGDPSDKIPGVRGIGPIAASKLLLTHGTLEGVLEAWGEHPETERALMFREIARMRHDAAVDLPEHAPDWLAGASALRAIGANALADRLAAPL